MIKKFLNINVVVDEIVNEFEYLNDVDVIDENIILISSNKFEYEIIEFIENEIDVDVEFKYIVDEINNVVVELFIVFDDDVDDPIIQQFKNEFNNIQLKDISNFLNEFYLNNKLNINQLDKIIKIVENKIDLLVYLNTNEINEFIKDIVIDPIL